MILFEKKKVSNLQPHPLLGTSGMLDELSRNELVKSGKGDAAQRALREAKVDELNLKLDSLQADIAKNGIIEPIKICLENGEWLIVDGRHRWMAAKALNRETVPCALVDPKNAREIILSAMLGKHLSKGARAYSAVQVHPEVALEAAKGKQMGTECPFKSQTDLALKIGVSERLMKVACALYRVFYNPDHKTLRIKYEKSVWTCQNIAKLLGEVDASVKRHDETGSYDLPKETKEKKEDREHRLAKAVALNFIKDSSTKALELNKGWQLFDESDETAAAEYISESIGLYPKAYLKAFVAAAEPLLEK